MPVLVERFLTDRVDEQLSECGGRRQPRPAPAIPPFDARPAGGPRTPVLVERATSDGRSTAGALDGQAATNPPPPPETCATEHEPAVHRRRCATAGRYRLLVLASRLGPRHDLRGRAPRYARSTPTVRLVITSRS